MHAYNNYYKNIFIFFILYIKMNGKNINFDDKKSKKLNFTKIKKYLI